MVAVQGYVYMNPDTFENVSVHISILALAQYCHCVAFTTSINQVKEEHVVQAGALSG